MKLNLGCGADYRKGYTNVDFRSPCDVEYNLSNIPWPFDNSVAEEILMLDFLEHFSYRDTDKMLYEAWRILKSEGVLIIQVPDFEHCANAALDASKFLCNVCGNSGKDVVLNPKGERCCSRCNTLTADISQAAIHRLYGGQDYEGNWHYTAFTKESLSRKLSQSGFGDFEFLEKHHQWLNWNFMIKAVKQDDVW